MRMANMWVPAAIIALALSGPGWSAELADEDSPFKEAARAISELHLLKLEAQLADARKAAETAETHGAAPPPPPKPVLPPTSVFEIGGGAGRFTAVIRLPDGHFADHVSGDIVPGFGRITVLANGVKDQAGRLHVPADASAAP
jgi:hypothetical protein